MSEKKQQIASIVHLIGCASGIAGADSHCEQGPPILKQSDYLSKLIKQGLPCVWDTMITQKIDKKLKIEDIVAELCQELAQEVINKIKKHEKFLVIGGDHSCAIGTWSGIANAYRAKGDVGLIWIDAHMDSHTPETSYTQHIHGMPLAALLGYGFKSLTNIIDDSIKIKPENTCLIGVRSFEAGEAALLKRLNVKIYFMDEVKQKGFTTVLQEAVTHVSQHTVGYGVTLDLDSIDPHDAPAVDVPENNGIAAAHVLEGLNIIARDPRLITAEIVEFDPMHDKNQITEKLVISFVETLIRGMIKQGS